MSGINPGFRPNQDFTGDITRKTQDFAKDTGAAFDAVSQQSLPKLTPSNLKSAAYTAQLDELVICSGTFSVTLPAPSALVAGRMVGVEVLAGVITVLPTQGLVQAGTSDVVSAVGLHLYVCDGTGWYRHGDSLTLTQFSQNIGVGTSGHFDITGLIGLTADKDVLLVQTAQPIASKGNARDEFEMDNIELTGYVVNSTTIRVYWRASGIVTGTYNFAYKVAA